MVPVRWTKYTYHLVLVQVLVDVPANRINALISLDLSALYGLHANITTVT